MNATVLRALLRDALYQIQDNKVFRLLLVLSCIPVLLSFLVGFGEDRISLLFGVKSYEYAPLLDAFGLSAETASAQRIQLIQWLQTLFVEQLAGNLGIIPCIAATAFFVPRMLERGTADTLFSKPIPRVVLLLARYVSGVLFVFLLAGGMILGVHAGLTLVSGYSDPGFLWGALTLTYVFALIHAFSTLVATLTRSSTAAVLCTLVFFVFNGCVHTWWTQVERIRTVQAEALDEGAAQAEQFDQVDFDEGMLGSVIAALDTAHYVLPKTSDADALTRMLRRSIEGAPDAILDPVGGLRVAPPDELGEGVVAELEERPADPEADFRLAWALRGADGEPLGELRLRRAYREHETLGDGSRGPELDQGLSFRRHGRTLVEALEQRPDVRDVDSVRESLSGRMASIVSWAEDSPDGPVRRQEILFTFEETAYFVDVTWTDDGLTADRRELALQRFRSGLSFPELDLLTARSPGEWYERQMGLGAPLRFNILFSIGSSLAFAFVMLFGSWLRLRTMEF